MQQRRELQCKPFPRLQLFRDSWSCQEPPWSQFLQEISSCYGLEPSLDQLWPFLPVLQSRTFSQMGDECSCSWKRLLHLDPPPLESWDKRHVAGDICAWVLQQLLLSSTDRKEVQMCGWVGTNNIRERGEALESTKKKEIVFKCGNSYRLQKCHKSMHFYDFFTPNWAQLHTQDQPWLIYFKLTQHQSQIPYYTKLFSLSYLPQTIKLNKWMEIIHSQVYEPEVPQRQ